MNRLLELKVIQIHRRRRRRRRRDTTTRRPPRKENPNNNTSFRFEDVKLKTAAQTKTQVGVFYDLTRLDSPSLSFSFAALSLSRLFSRFPPTVSVICISVFYETRFRIPPPPPNTRLSLLM